MGTGSFVLQKIYAFFLRLNFYFEHSLIFRAMTAVKNTARGSRILSSFISTKHRDYWGGSLIMRFIGLVARGIIFLAGWFVRGTARVNKTSLNRRLFYAVANSGFVIFLRKSIADCLPVRLARWFFGSCDCALKVMYMVFLTGALIIPAHLWNNLLLLVSAVLFGGLFALKRLLSEPSDERKEAVSISPALVLFIFFCALSIFTGYGGGDSFRVFLILAACVVHSILIALVIRKKEDLQMFFMLMAFVLAIMAAFGFYQLIMGIEIRSDFVDLETHPGLARLYSTMGNPNNDAMAWAMLLPFVFAAVVTVKSDGRRVILLGILLLVVAAFALTYSRAGYVALLAGAGIFVLMAAPRLVPVGIVLLLLALPFIPAGIMSRLLTIGQDTSSQYRFQIWEGVFGMLEDFWVRGIGMGPVAFVRIYRSYAHPAALRTMHAHNQFLDIIAHSGIGALLAFLAYLFRLFKRGIASHMASEDREYKIYMAAGIAALVVFIAFGVGEYVWFHPRVMLVFWMVAGLISAMSARVV